MTLIQQLGLSLTLLLIQLTAYAQKNDFLNKLDSMMILDQYYDKCTNLGTLNTHEQDSLMRLDTKLLSAYAEKVRQGYVKYDTITRDSLKKTFQIIRENNLKYIKWEVENNLVEKLNDYNGVKFTTIIVHSCTFEQINVLDSFLLDIFLRKIIKPYIYATTYDLLQTKYGLPQKYFTIYCLNKDTGKSCTQTPPNIRQTNLDRKEIGLKKWKLECM